MERDLVIPHRRVVPGAAGSAPVLFLALTLLVMPAATAHLVQTGFGPLVDSLFHAFIGPDAVLTAAAAGFLSGLRGGETRRTGHVLFLYGWGLFYVAGALSQYPFDYPFAVAGALLALGALTAADLSLPDAPLLAALVFAGGLHGLITGGAAEGLPWDLLAVMATADTVLITAICLGARALAVRFPPARIAVRVAGSWIAAIGLLQLGWAWRFRGQ